MHTSTARVLRLFGTFSVLAAVTLTGCETTPAPQRHVSSVQVEDVHREAAVDLPSREGTFVGELPPSNSGSSSAVVFSNPAVQRYYIAVRPEVLDLIENRRDGDLAIYDPAPRTAIDSWPTDPRPSLSRPRIARTLTYSPNTFIYYEVERQDGRYPDYDANRRWER